MLLPFPNRIIIGKICQLFPPARLLAWCGTAHVDLATSFPIRVRVQSSRKEELVPLRDHFHPPVENIASWEEVHGAWPATIAYRLNATLPPQYRCGVKVHLGTLVEVDVATFERDSETEAPDEASNGMRRSWEPESPTLLLETEELAPAEYEVRVYDSTRAQRLVAVVELVSPANKDRSQSRKAFVDKCHAMLQQGLCVVIVDIVTNYTANLYAELAARLGAKPPSIADCVIYAVTCRTRPGCRGVRVETWERELVVGAPLPTLPLHLSESFKVPLELEATYEDTCRGLRIP
jgi:hypothetical protein